MLKFDYYFYAFVDPLQALIQTITLTFLFNSPHFDDLLKFTIARFVGIVLKCLFVLGYLVYHHEDKNFLILRKVHDSTLGLDYFVHPSNKEFQKTFGLSTLIFFVCNNCERFLQVRLFSVEQLGFFGFLQGISDNLYTLAGAPFVDFLSNLFNLKFNLYWHCNDTNLANETMLEINLLYLRSLKYVVVFFQLLFLYASFMLLDPMIFPLFGHNYGNYVHLSGSHVGTLHGCRLDRHLLLWGDHRIPTELLLSFQEHKIHQPDSPGQLNVNSLANSSSAYLSDPPMASSDYSEPTSRNGSSH